MAALDAALALAEVDDVALAVGGDLNLDVVAALDQPLEIQAALAEMRLRLVLGDRKHARELVGVARDAHAAPAAAGDRLEHEREAQLARRRPAPPRRWPASRRCPGTTGTPAAFIRLRALTLSLKAWIELGRGADEA